MLIAIVAVLTLVVASCGSDDVASSSTTTATTAESTTTTTEPTSTTTSSTTTAAPQAMVQVYFSSGDGSDCSQVAAFDRAVPADSDLIAAALNQLVAGPTDDEIATGVGSFFSAETADVVSSVTLEDGLVLVDFADLRPLMPNASTSCGSMALMSQLNTTLFQFDEIERIIYQIDGSCALFGNWLQTECFSVGRDGQRFDVPTNEQASGAGCTPLTGEGLPDGRWFGYLDDARADSVDFDLACWFNGTAAALAAAEDGEESPPPNDYYVRNVNDLIRTLDVSTSAEVSWLPSPGDPATQADASYGEWLAERSDRPFQPGVWLTINEGQVTLIVEQYVP
ncbi:MAG: GerMN domain-containing protein [Acidimicrobiales bacterium]|nr:GerMN domain-containing protein [Acidimicrobiales bacterium]